ncbi:LysR family transcriptional regulator [Thetidibacter halocola]|uniref:LysR family transcriptional regulator n=1 Tax=Thetidibacter halocola TaxID=2827239 RepID=A0A8J7WEF4_9RHOB|nr:LysR family transcriptional regulator [Thetidibacter halocola]MBS0126112.1 LysR family transcriptional regulator [Thetidibacter halocola]
MRNLDITALRSFVAVAEAGGVTRAAGFLNLTQSAVSMQIKRLEETLELSLLERSGRGVRLTPAGAQLLNYAQKIIALNDEAYLRLTHQSWEGEIVLGVPTDIVYPAIPRVLQQLGRTHPRLKVQLISSYTRELKTQFARGEVDIILTTEDGVDPGGETLAEVPLRWVGAPDGQVWRARPLRLAFCRLCGFREGALRRLDEAGIDWEMAVDSDNDRTVEATVSADLGITSSLEGHAAPQLAYLDDPALPDLGKQKINLYAGTARPALVGAVCDALRQSFAAVAAAA